MGCENSKPEGTKESSVTTSANDIKDVSSDCVLAPVAYRMKPKI
jgi:hypothetical protein